MLPKRGFYYEMLKESTDVDQLFCAPASIQLLTMAMLQSEIMFPGGIAE